MGLAGKDLSKWQVQDQGRKQEAKTKQELDSRLRGKDGTQPE